MERYIREDELTSLLRVRPGEFVAWRRNGYIKPDARDETVPGAGDIGHPLYLHTTVDALLQNKANNKTMALPSVAELLALRTTTRRPVLLTAQEACKQLGKPTWFVDKLISQGDLLATRIIDEGNWLVIPSAITTYLKSVEGIIPAELAARILGVSTGSKSIIHQLSSSDNAPLVRAKLMGKRSLSITVESFMTFLDMHVMGVTGEVWWQMRVDHDFEPLLSVKAICARYKVHIRMVKARIRDGTFPCIQLTGKERVRWLVATHTVERWAADRRAFKPETLAAIFGTNPATIATWRHQDLCPKRHDFGGGVARREVCPARACVINYINSHRTSQDFDGELWLRSVFEDKAIPIPARQIGFDQNLIEKGLKANTLHGIYLPDGSLVLTRQVARSLRRQERMVMGGDYHRHTYEA